MLQLVSDLNDQGFKLQDNLVVACNGLGLKNLLQAGKQRLETHVGQINRLNVFPVPDGDTGTNMLLTMMAALAEIERTADHRVEAIAAAAAQGALLGARGNSGLILSQFLAGLALGLRGKTIFTAKDFAAAVQMGVERAYQSVIRPVEGTILTVSRAAAEAAARAVENDDDLIRLFLVMVEAAKAAQRCTPELLPLLKEAGVTDSGGQGLLYILEGGLRFIQHEPVELALAEAVNPPWPALPEQDDASYGYDIQFLLYGEGLAVEAIRADLETMGQSVLVVGDRQRLKIHIHAANPGPILTYGTSSGLVTDLLIEDMTAQVKAFAEQTPLIEGQPVKPPVKNIAIIAVAPGPGLIDILQSLGADQLILRNETVTPGLQPWLKLIETLEADRIIVLPDKPDIISVIEQVQTWLPIDIRVMPTQTVPQAIAAMLAFNPQVDFEANVQRMLQASRQIRTFEVKPGGEQAEVLGFYENKLILIDSDEDVVTLALLAKAEAKMAEVATIYFGQNISQTQADQLAGQINACYPEITVEVYDGGQPRSYYIISLE